MKKGFSRVMVYVLIGVLALATVAVFAQEEPVLGCRFGFCPKIEFSESEIADIKETYIAKISEIIDSKISSGEITQEDANAFLERLKQGGMFQKGMKRQLTDEEIAKLKESGMNGLKARRGKRFGFPKKGFDFGEKFRDKQN